MKIKSKEWKWTREPKDCSITDVVAGVKLPKNAGEKFPLLGI